MNKAKEIGNIALWLVGHLAFTLILNLTVLGGYYAYTVHQSWTFQITEEMLREMDDQTLNDISKGIFHVLENRQKAEQKAEK